MLSGYVYTAKCCKLLYRYSVICEILWLFNMCLYLGWIGDRGKIKISDISSWEDESFANFSFGFRVLLEMDANLDLCRCELFVSVRVLFAIFSFIIFMDVFFLGEGFTICPDIFLLLIPPPLVDLRLWEASSIGHLYYLFFRPIRLFLQFLLQNFYLNSALSLPLPDSILREEFLIDFLKRFIFRGIFLLV